MYDLYNLKDMLCHELEEYGKLPELSLTSLATIDTLAHACKNVCKIIECKDGGYSRGCSHGYRDRGADVARRLRDMANETPDESVRHEIERLADRMSAM